MSPYISYSSTRTVTYYHCDICREKREGEYHQCYACQKILCPECNLWGLCPDHFARLSPQDQYQLQLYDREVARTPQPAQAKAKLAIVDLLQQYFEFGAINWGKTDINPNKAKAELRKRNLLASDDSFPPPEITPPIKAAKTPSSYSGTAQKCWICGATEVGSDGSICLLCGAFLCARCSKSGLCPDHHAHLTPRQQTDMKTCYEDQREAEARLFRPISNAVYILGMIVLACVVFIGLAPVLPAPLVPIMLWVLSILAFIVAVVAKVQRDHLRPARDRANLAIQTFLDNIPASAKIPPVCHDPLLNRPPEGGSDEVLQVRAAVTQAKAVMQHMKGGTGEQTPREIPFQDDKAAITDWKDFVDSKFPCLYCPDCKVNHPAYARHCIFCGKALLNKPRGS